ncbi:TetR/AcrR family transcriptional regulator [Sphingomonas bacterium]|uniref:TetR/AcrR family transcriptional regulator n=1 Tax=Sphingomonas bacterium TaxID=1895847 RepID=UPI001575EFCD|nr:TetR/AcrR family transcriptional regulator [Sphingomonas bacterium]
MATRKQDAGAPAMRRELLADEVLDKAAALFAAKGFAATSLKDVADAVGLSRSSIYYYYPNKDALLAALIRGVTLPVANIFRDVDQALSPQGRIREVVRRLVLWAADPKTHFRLMDQSEAELPPAIAKAHVDAKRRILSEMVRLIDAAILAGEARPVDPRVAAFSIIGMAMWTAWWFQPRHGPGIEEVATAIAENAVASLHRADSRPAATVPELMREIRDNLSLVETMAGRDRAAAGTTPAAPVAHP